MLKFIIFLTLASGGLCLNLTKYSQKDYIMKTERFEMVESNENYLGNFEMKHFKYNRTHFALNASGTWEVDLHGPVTIIMQGYKFASNEYRLFAFYFQLDLCDALERNLFGLENLYDCGTMYHCPIKKGNFVICNWTPDYTQYPPHAPRGRYMITMDWKHFGITMVKMNWYIHIEDVPLIY